MTNLQAITHLIGSNADLTEADIRFACELEGLNPDEVYSSDSKCKIYRLAILSIQKNKGVKSESEGGYSKTYTDLNTLDVIKALANQSECPELIAMVNTQPKIKNKTNIW